MTGGAAVSQVVGLTTVTGSASQTTSNFILTEGDMVIFMAIVSSGSPFTATTTLSGKGYTYNKVGEAVSGNDLIVFFVGYGTFNAGADTNSGLTMTFSRAPTAGQYWVGKMAGVTNNGLNPVAASNSTSGTGTSGSIVLTPAAVVDAGSRLGIWLHKANEATTPDSTGATWAEDQDGASSTSVAKDIEIQRLFGSVDNTHTASWTTSSFYLGAVIQLQTTPAISKLSTYQTPVKIALRPTVIDEDADVYAIIG